ncbi:MAG: hypothetical protein KDC80_09460 [Saprospiraceae bacterium]|nr:hypothetical protein [Saprospiraceae bacterium]
MRALIISVFLILPLISFSQRQLYGSWQGKMSTPSGNYVFNLDLRPSPDGTSSIRGTAIHNRNGEKQVIDLEGIIYGDQSIYLSDVADPLKKLSRGDTFSRLQFTYSYQSGELVLSGHWQEYQDMSHYRRGRLVLFRKSTKA